MMSNNQNVYMQVPANMVEDLQNYMNNLQIQEQNLQSQNQDVVPPQNDAVCVVCNKTTKCKCEFEAEVQDIVGHRTVNGNLQYKVVWKHFLDEEWVYEEDCACEDLIAKYLAKTGMKTIYLICRVSTKEQAEDSKTSLKAQERELRRAASEFQTKYSRIKVVSFYGSAYSSLSKKLQNLQVNRNDVFLVWRVDRFCRNLDVYYTFLKELESKNVDVYSTQEKVSLLKNKSLFFQYILDAQKESENIGKRVKLTKQFRKEQLANQEPFHLSYRDGDGDDDSDDSSE